MCMMPHTCLYSHYTLHAAWIINGFTQRTGPNEGQISRQKRNKSLLIYSAAGVQQKIEFEKVLFAAFQLLLNPEEMKRLQPKQQLIQFCSIGNRTSNCQRGSLSLLLHKSLKNQFLNQSKCVCLDGDKHLFVSVCFSMGKSMSKRFALFAEEKYVNGGQKDRRSSTGLLKPLYMRCRTSLRACLVCFFWCLQ